MPSTGGMLLFVLYFCVFFVFQDLQRQWRRQSLNLACITAHAGALGRGIQLMLIMFFLLFLLQLFKSTSSSSRVKGRAWAQRCGQRPQRGAPSPRRRMMQPAAPCSQYCAAAAAVVFVFVFVFVFVVLAAAAAAASSCCMRLHLLLQ